MYCGTVREIDRPAEGPNEIPPGLGSSEENERQVTPRQDRVRCWVLRVFVERPHLVWAKFTYVPPRWPRR